MPPRSSRLPTSYRLLLGPGRRLSPTGTGWDPLKPSGHVGPPTSVLLAGPPVDISKKVIRQIGKRLTAMALKKARSRMMGHLRKGSRAWAKAFEHISTTHFSKAPFMHRAVHAVFKDSYRTKKAVEDLVAEAVTKPGRVILSKATDLAGVALGTPVVIIEKEFRDTIGTELARKGKQIVEESCKILRIVVDYTGRPLSAYPVKGFLKKGSIVASVAITVSAVENAYAAEISAEEDWSNWRCGFNSWLDWLPIPIIDISSSCIAPDPPRRTYIKKRAIDKIAAIEKKLGYKLDGGTRSNIYKDISAIWAWPMPEKGFQSRAEQTDNEKIEESGSDSSDKVPDLIIRKQWTPRNE